MGILNIFKFGPLRQYLKWKELGSYTATFSSFGNDIYKSEIIRSCIRPIVEHTSKATAKCKDKNIEYILNNTPNMYMNGKAFLAKVRTILEIKNTSFIYIQRDDLNKVIGFYPVPYSYFEALEYNNGLFIKFHFMGDATNAIVIPWEDLAVLRKDYNKSDIAGDENDAILNTLELINVSNQGVANAVKATANLRGILKSTKGMLDPEDIKKEKDRFVKDYMSIDNEGGIASLDATQEFTPITMSPTVANYMQMKEFRENAYRYYGVNDSIIMNDYTEAQMESFYEGKIETFLVDLSTELTRKIYSKKAMNGFENYIIYEANKMQFSTMKTKISVFKDVVLYGGMTINEWRAGCNMAPLEGGDEPIRRLDAAKVNEKVVKEGENEDES